MALPLPAGICRRYLKRMLDSLLRSALRWTGKEHLVPFVESLMHLGRPATVLFPRELLEQGAAIALSGISNTMAIQSNPDWIWPLWVERQTDPDAEEFVPTGLNLFTTNVTRRNWTSIGVDGSRLEAMIDPVGMTTLRPYGWSLLPFLRLDGRLFLPPRESGKISQRLVDDVLPVVLTRYHADERLSWTLEATALECDGEEGVLLLHRLANLSERRLEFSLGMALRPYNPLMLGHINRLRLKGDLWRVNGRPGLLLVDPPSRSHVSDRHKGDPMLVSAQGTAPLSLRSKSGVAGGTSEWFVSLAPSQERTVALFAPLRHTASRPVKFRPPRASRLMEARAQTLESWRAEAKEGTHFDIPDPELSRLLTAVRLRLPAFDDGEILTPGTFLYHGFWFRDGAFLAAGFENLGLGRRIVDKIRHFSDRQRRDGFFQSQDGEWDSNGQALWTAVQHVRRGGSPELLEKAWNSFWKGARWIESFRATTTKSPSAHFGLLPAGFSAEHFGPNDHYYWDNFWSLAGLRELAWAARLLGKRREEEQLETWGNGYRADLHASILQSLERMGDGTLPPSPYRRFDAASVGNLACLSPLRLCDGTIPWARPTVELLWEHHRRDGLFFQSIVHTGLNPYLSAQLARALLVLEDSRWLDVVHALARRATSTGCWPEAIHPRTGGGCMGDGDHGWSAAEFASLLREAFVREEEDCLVLLGGVPEAWLEAGCGVREATSEVGTISVSCRREAGRLQVSWECRRASHQDERPLELSLPGSGGRRRIRLPSASGSIDLEEQGGTP